MAGGGSFSRSGYRPEPFKVPAVSGCYATTLLNFIIGLFTYVRTSPH